MAIITTTTIAITAKVIFISFGLAGFFNQFTRSPFSKNYTTMWVLLSSQKQKSPREEALLLLGRVH